MSVDQQLKEARQSVDSMSVGVPSIVEIGTYSLTVWGRTGHCHRLRLCLPVIQKFCVRNAVYQFHAPFGLAAALREFTKLLLPVLEWLRREVVWVHVNLDDWFVRGTLKEEVIRGTD